VTLRYHTKRQRTSRERIKSRWLRRAAHSAKGQIETTHEPFCRDVEAISKTAASNAYPKVGL
jgi:hypothetical protein